MTLDEVRTLVLNCLRKPRSPDANGLQVLTLQAEVAEFAKLRALMHKTGAGEVPAWQEFRGHITPHPALKAMVLSIVWDLIIEGVVRPGLNDGNHEDLPFRIETTPRSARRPCSGAMLGPVRA